MKASWPYLKWRYLALRNYTIHAVCKRLYRNPNRDIRRSLLVVGTARSGTTWLADIISSQIPCRIMFEPFQSSLVEEFRQFDYFQYMRPSEPNKELSLFCQKVFTGDIRHPWIDSKVNCIFSEYRLIKDIRANLFLKWIHDRFPDIFIFFLIRHPCAVVLSRMKLRWATDTDIEALLSQQKLVDDFISNKIDIIRRAKTIEEKHAIIWCISNLVPIKQFESSKLNIIFYENLCTQPEMEIPKTFQRIQHPYQQSIFESIYEPSATAKHSSAIITGGNRITGWMKELSSSQIRKILNIVEAFELENIYGESYLPLVSDLSFPSDKSINELAQ